MNEPHENKKQLEYRLITHRVMDLPCEFDFLHSPVLKTVKESNDKDYSTKTVRQRLFDKDYSTKTNYCPDNLECALKYGIKPRAISSADGALTSIFARWSELLGQTGEDNKILTHIVT
jgi:hypothetical protein